ncbi:hypothetical protein [Tolypothrix sp. FACHB-123]|uniref:hypothetical protein n=1 Tax=Tolypothrix sp. FACHB-123 TaxID=2692868 RepID=UPI0018F04D76|nr:hypothetical protein [Tolypothrix sp. FACHB-123]
MDNLIEYRCRIAIEAQESNVALVNFLKTKETLAFTERDKVFSALSAYWLPFALRNAGCSDSQSKQCAKNAIYRLKLHISYLVESFGLDNEDFVTQPVKATEPISPVNKTPKIDVDLTPSTAKASSEDTPELNLEQLIHHEDDSTFEGLFN